MTHLALLEAPVTVPTPRFLCGAWGQCPRHGRAVWGESKDLGGCVNRPVRCLTCGARGETSTRKGEAIA